MPRFHACLACSQTSSVAGSPPRTIRLQQTTLYVCRLSRRVLFSTSGSSRCSQKSWHEKEMFL